MTDQLQETLRQLLSEGSNSNPALSSLLRDYRKYHVVLVVLGAAFVLGFLLLSVWSWRRFKRSQRGTFERRTCLFFVASSLALGLIMAVVVAANLSNVVNPRHGFAGSIGMIGVPPAGTPAAMVHDAFTTWLQSGRAQTPALVRSKIDERLAWQRPKAIICAVLLVVFVGLGARTWRTLVRRSRSRGGRWSLRDAALLAAGVGTGLACVLLIVMVIGNTQASFAPLSMTLFFG